MKVYTSYSYQKPLQACSNLEICQETMNKINIGTCEQDGLAIWALSTGEHVSRHTKNNLRNLLAEISA